MQAQKYKKTGNRGLFDEQETHQRLSSIGNPLEMISKVIEFEMFRDMLEAELLNTNKKNNAGAKPFDVVTMFKILILQRYYGLGDTQIEYQILDRLSFKKFLGLESGDKVPDEKTVWAFREKLTNNGLVEDIFSQFTKHLESKGFIINEGKMVDASFTVAPRQRNTREENKRIKEGNGDELWNDKPNKKRHKNIDASVHDSQPLDDLLTEDDSGQDFFADSAYTGEEQEKVINKYEMNNKVHEKGYRNKPLTDEQKANNKEKSKTRARVEHVFGFMEQSMNGLIVRSVGIKRAAGIIGLINLTYNLFRYEQVIRLNIV
jgi:transposase, IS5 family